MVQTFFDFSFSLFIQGFAPQTPLGGPTAAKPPNSMLVIASRLFIIRGTLTYANRYLLTNGHHAKLA